MSLSNRVLWKEGLFIRPQHFQQESRFLTSQLKQVIDISKFDVSKPRSAKGHTPLEVVVGAVIGLLAGIVVFLATKN